MANEDKAARYHRLRRQASLAGTTAAAFLLIVLVFSGGAAALRTMIESVTGGRFVPGVVLYAVAVVLACDLLALPLAFYQGMTLEHRYGLSTQTAAAWFRDHAKASAVAVVFLSAGALIIATLMRWTPGYWWVIGTLVFGGLLSLLARIAPVVLMPLFYHLAPLDRASLTERLLAPWRSDPESQRRARRSRTDAAHPALGHVARASLRRRDRGHRGARTGAPRPPRHALGSGRGNGHHRRRTVRGGLGHGSGSRPVRHDGQGRSGAAAAGGTRAWSRLARADAAGARAVARPRAACRFVCPEDDAEPRCVRQRHAAAGGAEPGRRPAAGADRVAVPLASVHRRSDRA